MNIMIYKVITELINFVKPHLSRLLHYNYGLTMGRTPDTSHNFWQITLRVMFSNYSWNTEHNPNSKLMCGFGF